MLHLAGLDPALMQVVRSADPKGGHGAIYLWGTDITAIMVTHDQEEALTTVGRIGMLRQGRLLQVGTPSALYGHPADRIVASFLGAASILSCTVQRRWA